MPLQNRLANDYDPTDGLASGIRGIGSIMAQLPAIRARGALMNAQRGRTDAQTQLYQEHADLYKQMGLKNADELDAAQGIASEFQNVQKNPDGSLTIPADSLGKIAGLLARTGKGASDIGGGVQKLFQTANAPTEEAAGRQNKIDVAKVKPIVLNPGQTAVPNEVQPQVDPDTGDPSNVANRIIASVPPNAAKALPDYTTTTIRQERNPAYNIQEGATNVPPVINMTNIVRRMAGAAAPQAAQPQAQQIPQAHAAYLLAHPETAGQFDQKYGSGSAASILKQSQP